MCCNGSKFWLYGGISFNLVIRMFSATWQSEGLIALPNLELHIGALATRLQRETLSTHCRSILMLLVFGHSIKF